MKLTYATKKLEEAAKKFDSLDYDIIVCGIGYAGAIMTARVAERNPGKKILAIEYGGYLQAATGGSLSDMADITWQADMFQNEGIKSEDVDGKDSTYNPLSPLTMPDVPGNYNNVAFRPIAENGYQVKDFEACFQGSGLGGNGAYNGALYQEPDDWWWDDDKVHRDIFLGEDSKDPEKKVSEVLQPYIDRVRKELKDAVKTTPSMDGVHYNHGLYDLVKPHLDKHEFQEIPYYENEPEKQVQCGSLKGAGKRFYTVPAVNAKDGVRTGASAWIEKFLNEKGHVKYANLTVLTHTEVLKVNLDSNNKEVTGVNVIDSKTKRGGTGWGKSWKKTQGTPYDIKLKTGGKVILSCNALPTARLLYKSGVGPEAVRETVLPSSKKDGSTFKNGFIVDNEAIGTTINEHITTSLGFKYTGKDRKQPNTIHFGDSKDWVGNSDCLAQYARERSGPYAQFGPVVASHFVADHSRCKDLPEEFREGNSKDGEVTTELFYNPFGAGPYPPKSNPALNPYNGPGTFTVYVMLLRPESRAIFTLDDNDKPVYTTCYMNDKSGPDENVRKALNLPDYNAGARRDIATMAASVHEVLEITTAPDIKINLGPGDGHSTHLGGVKAASGGDTVAQLDPTNIKDVMQYVTYYDESSIISGEYLAITHMEENHYHSAVPLARNLDVFGEKLSDDRKAKYGLNPDNCEVRGTKGLCVVDASIFPKVVYCHPIAAVMILAEWAADKIQDSLEGQ